MSNVEKLKRAKNSRSIEINRMRELLAVAQSTQIDAGKRAEFIQRYKFVDTIHQTFSKFHNAVCTLVAPDADAGFAQEDKVRLEFEKAYFSTKAIFYNLYETEHATKKEDTEVPRTKLPELKLIKFNGDIKYFTAFIDVFDALIHNNSHLTDIEKFSHLLASVEGPPRNLIQCHALSAANYSVAYKSLKARYSSKRLLATYHWNEIENATRLTCENPPALRKLLDTFTENIAALKNLDFPVTQWDFILAHMLLKRLDPGFVSRFELQYGSTETPTFEELKQFVSKQCTAYETICSGSTAITQPTKSRINSPRNYQTAQLLPRRTSNFCTAKNTHVRPCIFCNTTDHLIYGCPLFLNKTPRERHGLVKQYKLCVNCLSHSHSSQACNSSSTCKSCHSRHHTLLHFGRNSNYSDPSASTSNSNQPTQPVVAHKSDQTYRDSTAPTATINCAVTSSKQPASNSHSLIHHEKTNQAESSLPTIQVQISSSFGHFIPARALLDSGSESSYVSQELVARLDLKPRTFSFNIFGLGGMKIKTSAGEVYCCIRPLVNMLPEIEFNAIILENLCSEMPANSFDISTWRHIKGLKLADPEFIFPNLLTLFWVLTFSVKFWLTVRYPQKVIICQRQFILPTVIFSWGKDHMKIMRMYYL